MKIFIDYQKIDGRTRKMMTGIAPEKAEKLARESKRCPGRLLFEPEHFGGLLNHYPRIQCEGEDWMIPLEHVGSKTSRAKIA